MGKRFPVAILAGGLATRLRPVTETLPKSLIPIKNEPFIYHQLRLLAAHDFKEVVLCTGFLGHLIEEAVGDGAQFGLKVRYSADGEILRGTGGAIQRALPLLGDAFFVLYGDSYLKCDYAAIQAQFEISNTLALMTVYRNEGLWDNSNVVYQDGRILQYDKVNRTKEMLHIDYGLGILTQAAFQYAGSETSHDLAHLYQSLQVKQQLAGFEVTERFYEVGSFSGITDLEAVI